MPESKNKSTAQRAFKQGEHALLEFDQIIHERIRLGIISALATNGSLSFAELKHVLATTDGNLSVHARRLENAQYIQCIKSFEGRLPKTEYRLTPAGRRSFAKYLKRMEALIGSMKRAQTA